VCELSAGLEQLDQRAANTTQKEETVQAFCADCRGVKPSDSVCVDCEVGFTLMGLRDDVYLHSRVPGRKKKKELRKTVREILKDLEVKVRGIRTESEQLAVIAEIGLAIL
jgi:hypothetical protein